MTIKEKIEKDIKEYSKHHFLEPGSEEDVIFRKGCSCGAEIAIKEVIEMLEEREKLHIRNTEIRREDECWVIINLLKSEE